MASNTLVDTRPHIRIKLAAIWTSVTLCYLYCDYFALYIPGKMQSILDGQMGPFGATTQGVLLGTGLLLIIPSLMPALTLLMPARPVRIANIVFGIFYTLVMIATMLGTSWHFYRMYALVEILLTAYAAWLAWKWPRTEAVQ